MTEVNLTITVEASTEMAIPEEITEDELAEMIADDIEHHLPWDPSPDEHQSIEAEVTFDG